MKQALCLLAAVAALILVVHAAFGYRVAYALGYGAIALMGAMIAGTFLWLYLRRETPLALGMAFSWAGTASVLGWWWIFNVLGRPEAMAGHAALLVFVALCIAGAILHFTVIQRSMDMPRRLAALPVGAAFILSGLIVLLTR